MTAATPPPMKQPINIGTAIIALCFLAIQFCAVSFAAMRGHPYIAGGLSLVMMWLDRLAALWLASSTEDDE